MAALTGSGMDRANQCPASLAIPGVHESGVYAESGNETHAKIERVLRGEHWEAAGLAFSPLACLPPGTHSAEVPYAYDPISDTGRRLPQQGHRNYDGVVDHEIPMTLDVVTVSDSGVTLTDWKSGFLGASVETLQLTIAALAVARANGLDSVTVQIAHVLTDGKARVTERTLDALDLDAAADHVRRIVDRVNEARAIVASGRVPDVYPDEDACRYCPARSVTCPAYTTAIRTVLSLASPADAATSIAALTLEQKGQAWLWKKRAEDFVEAVDRALRHHLKDGPIPLGDGKEVALVEQVQHRAVTLPTGETKEVRFMKAISRKATAA